MHYYSFNVADYRKDTVHLSPIEHYIYRSLLDSYYLNESPISSDKEFILRMLRLSKKESKSLENVLKEFFELSGNFYIHQRVERELSKIYNKSEKAKTSAKVRWDNANAMRTHSERNANGMLPNNPIPNNPITQLNTDIDKSISVVKVEGTLTNDEDKFLKRKMVDIPYQEIIDLYQEKLPMLNGVYKLTEQRKAKIKTLWTTTELNTVDRWGNYFSHVGKSKFLTGRTQDKSGRLWKADLDFLINHTNFIKISEDKYHG